MWNAYRHRLCAGSSLQQARGGCQSLQVGLRVSECALICIHLYLHSLFLIVVFDLRVKKQAQDRPMSMWISSIKQLDPVRHLLSPLLLDFMEAAWPSSISMVIPRGSLRSL